MAGVLPVASSAVSASIPPTDVPNHEEADDADRARAAAALREAFDRLAPQGSDQWNFLGAFTHLGDRYGPYHPGASGLSELLGPADREQGSRQTRLGRLTRRRESGSEGEPTDLENAMAQVVEAFRFLSARVQTLEERLARQDRPVEGAAWLVPAEELGELVAPVTSYLLAHRADDGGLIVHGDCGSGALLQALGAAGLDAHGVEPRGAVALGALERGCDVAMCELSEDLAARPGGSLGGLVVSGVVDRVPLHALLALLAQSRRVLALAAPLVVVVSDAGAETSWEQSSRDLIDGRPLSAGAWQMLLNRAGFVGEAPLEVEGLSDRRQIITASVPA